MNRGFSSVAVLAVLAAGLAISTQAGAQEAEEIPPIGEYLDQYNQGQEQQQRSSLASFEDVVVTLTADSPLQEFLDAVTAQGGDIPFVYQYALTGFSGELPSWVVEALRDYPDVLAVEPNVSISIVAQTIPSGISRVGATGNPEVDIDGVDERVDVDVAIIDTGIDSDNPDLNVVLPTRGCLTGTCTTGTGEDDHFHGTHVAGTVAALDNGSGVVGVAPGARLHAIKVCNSSGSCPSSAIIAGIDYVTSQALVIEVINMSLGGPGTNFGYNTAITGAANAGVITVVAAGNSGQDAAGFTPANSPDAFTVSATVDTDGIGGGVGGNATCSGYTNQEDDTRASFSNYGSTIDIAAPGVCVESTYYGGSPPTVPASGTSMASPHVAGAAALLASMNKPLNKTDVNALKATLIAQGTTTGWTGGSGEPLLDVSNTTVFDPVCVGGCGNVAPAEPVAAFTFDPAAGGDAPIEVSFTDTSTGTITSWDWTFGDGGTSTDQNPDHTYNTADSYTASLTVTGPGGSNTFDATVEVTGGTPSATSTFMSFYGTTTLPVVGKVKDEDIVSYNAGLDAWALFFDGSDVGLGSTDINAFHVRPDGAIIISLNKPFNVPGLTGGPNGTSVDDSDLILFTPTSTGSATAGSFSFYLDGSDLLLTTNGEDIDAVWEDPSTGDLYISTIGTARTPERTRDEDVLRLSGVTKGANSAGTWSLYFDGADVGFDVKAEDLDAAWFSGVGADLLFSTQGSFSVDGASGDDEDLAIFSGTYGSTTSGSSTLTLDLTALGIDATEDIDGVWVG